MNANKKLTNDEMVELRRQYQRGAAIRKGWTIMRSEREPYHIIDDEELSMIYGIKEIPAKQPDPPSKPETATLRDQLAMAAPIELPGLAELPYSGKAWRRALDINCNARYEWADCMLEARKK